MKLVKILALMLFAQTAMGANIYLKVGDAIKLGSDQIFCGEANPPAFQCNEECQYWDEFKKVCHYRVKCEFTELCAKRTQCEKWDEFKKVCRSDSAQLYCVNMKSICEEKCTHYDDFKKICNYRTSCMYAAGCYMQKYCEKWDDFKKVCLSEAKKTTCSE